MTDPCLLPAGAQIPAGLGVSTVHPSLDFETYSPAGYVIDSHTGKVRGVGSQGKGGLPVVGTPVYAAHPDADILSLVYDLKDGKGRRLWFPGLPNPADLLAHVANGGALEGHNVTFEFWVWNMVGVRRYGWPPLPLQQCYCSMAKARRHSLPGGLDALAKVLGTTPKDPDGKRLIAKLTRPVSVTKKNPTNRWTPATAWDDFCKLYQYNDGDVVSEDRASARVPDLTPAERQTWLTDQTINARGVAVDTVTLDAALSVLAQAECKYTLELAEVTAGAVGSIDEVEKLRVWAGQLGAHLPDVTKDTVDAALSDGRQLPAAVRRALEIRQTLGAANIKKLRSLKLQVSSDGRLRDQYKYCGADRTGRWAAGGVQLQNITAKGPKAARCRGCGGIFGRDTAAIGCPRCGDWVQGQDNLPEWTIEAVLYAINDIRTADLTQVEWVWGDAIAVMCGCLRGLFLAPTGKKLVCCDYSAIEAVVAACLARCQWRIDVFSTPGECIYTRSASKITGTPLEVYKQYKNEHGTHHPDRKKIGKVAELASGYGGWINAWRAFGADMPDGEIKESILAWRDASPEIVEMWGGQYRWCGPGKWDYMPELFGLEGAAINAVRNPGQCFGHNDISYGVHGDVLYCRLPSGRFLHYHRPQLSVVADKLNRGDSYQLTFEGWNSNSAKGPVGWHRMETFGGRLFENVVQAVALDLQADALTRLERAGYPVVMHTHDEAVAETPDSPEFNVGTMAAIMSERPAWASWWPIRAAGWEHQRYQKD